MDVMGEALHITRKHLLTLVVEEAELSVEDAADIIERTCQVASGFTARARQQLPGAITRDTLRTIQARIDGNTERLA